ncbi:hypothetical protein A2U01_0073473, partial [Trifolium medium]|nr:hypothetical protein [Trifolium medium]
RRFLAGAIESEQMNGFPEGLSLEPEKASKWMDNPKVPRWSERKRAKLDDSEVYRTRACKPRCEGTSVAGRASRSLGERLIPELV